MDAWAVPCATDIAFASIGERAVWGTKHPAVTFLIALAVADDFIGMGIIAVFYPQRPFNLGGLLLVALGATMAFVWPGAQGMSVTSRPSISVNWRP